MTVTHHVIASFSPSCMIVFRRELVNIFVFSTTKELYSPSIPIVKNNINMDIEVDTPRRRSDFFSVNNSRELSVYSSISSIKRMKAQSNNPLWTEQMETEKLFVLQELRLFYTTPKVEEREACNNTVPSTNMSNSYRERLINYSINICIL